MIDINLFRENPKAIKDSQKKRGDGVKLVDEVIKYDKLWRELNQKADKLKHKRNVVSLEINKLKKQGKSAGAKIKDMRTVVAEINKLDNKITDALKKRDEVRVLVGNVLAKDVPVGKDESDNKTIRMWGKKPKFDFKHKDHIELGEALDLFNVERGADVAGARWYYGKNELVILDFALARYALDFSKSKGFTLFMPPNLLREKVLWAAAFLPQGKEDLYYVKDEDLILVGTSEQALAALHMDELMKEADLPKFYSAFSACYRTEAGSHGRDTKGIFRVHQFNKVEQFIFCKPKDSEKWFEWSQKVSEEFFQSLGFPYRVVNVCTGDLSLKNHKQYDIEAWLPGQNGKKGAYREITSCSNCTDYQMVRFNTRFADKASNKEYVHTINNTGVATGRTMVAILENFQQKDGSVKIPKVLWPYTGFKVIKKKK